MEEVEVEFVVLKKNKNIHGEVFNFGPSIKNKMRVIDIVKSFYFITKRFIAFQAWVQSSFTCYILHEVEGP